MVSTSSSLESSSPQVLPVRHLACDYPPMEMKGVAAVSWSLLPVCRATTMTARLGSPHYFIVRTECQLVVLSVIVRAFALCKVRRGPRRPDRVAPPCAWVKVHA